MSSQPRDRVFLDSNVLFSAAYQADSRFRRLWRLPGVTLLTSLYVIAEVTRNLAQEHHRRLRTLLAEMEVVEGEAPLPPGIRLPAKDQPILRAAIAGGATHLLTGDTLHFGGLYGRKVGGVAVLPRSLYLAP